MILATSRFYCHLSFPAVSDHLLDFQAHALLQPPPSTYHFSLWLRAEASTFTSLFPHAQQKTYCLPKGKFLSQLRLHFDIRISWHIYFSRWRWVCP